MDSADWDAWASALWYSTWRIPVAALQEDQDRIERPDQPNVRLRSFVRASYSYCEFLLGRLSIDTAGEGHEADR